MLPKGFAMEKSPSSQSFSVSRYPHQILKLPEQSSNLPMIISIKWALRSEARDAHKAWRTHR